MHSAQCTHFFFRNCIFAETNKRVRSFVGEYRQIFQGLTNSSSTSFIFADAEMGTEKRKKNCHRINVGKEREKEI